MNCISNRLVVLTLAISSSLSATIINVPADSSTIQSALNGAVDGDTVLVQPGAYYENIFWPDVNGIKLISAGDSSNTIIDGGGNSSVIYMNPSTATIDSTTEIRGFKITNGGNIANGGGMFISSASPVLTRLWVTGNTATSVGGGLYIFGGSPTLTDVTVTDNTAGSGGGIYIWGSATLTHVTVTGNTATKYGGGGLRIYYGSPTLTDVTVTGNTASSSSGGGLYISGGSPTLTDVTVSGNTAGAGGGFYIVDGSPILTHVTVTGNTAIWGGGLDMNSSSPTLSDVTVTGNTATISGGGLQIQYGSPTLTGVTITGNMAPYHRGGGLYIYSSTPAITGSNIAYNGTGLYNADNTNTIDATSNWWGDSSGPYHPQQNAGGLGNSVNAYVNIIPFLTEPDTAAPPIPVQNLQVFDLGEDFISLSWDESPMGDLAGYKVYYDSDSTGFPYADTVDLGNNTSTTLSGLMPGLTYYIAATCYDTDGNEGWYSNEISATTEVLSIDMDNLVPKEFALHQNYPNPFNPTSTIQYDLPEAANVTLVVYDILGREVIRLVSQEMQPGYHVAVWDAKDHAGRAMPTGIYLARVVTPAYTKSIKMLLLK